jgi:hypothetical protein
MEAAKIEQQERVQAITATEQVRIVLTQYIRYCIIKLIFNLLEAVLFLGLQNRASYY